MSRKNRKLFFEILEDRLEMSADLVNFVLPYDAHVYFQTVGGSAGAETDFGIGTNPSNAEYFISGPNNPTQGRVSVGDFKENDLINFAMLTHWQHRDYFASSANVNSSDAKEAFLDLNGNNVILMQTSENTWKLSLDDAASNAVAHDDDDNDIYVEIYLERKPVVVEQPVVEVPPPVVIPPAEEPSQLPIVENPPVDPITPPVDEIPPVVEQPPLENPVVPPTEPVTPPTNDNPIIINPPPFDDPIVVNPPGHNPPIINPVPVDPVDSIPPIYIPPITGPLLPEVPPPVAQPKLVDLVNLVVPFDGVLYVKFVSSSAGAINIFGTGTTSANFDPIFKVTENQSDKLGFIRVDSFKKGDVIPFAIDSKYNGQSHYAFSIGTDDVSKEAFSDTNNSLKLGGSVLTPLGSNKWRLSLDDGWTGDDDDNDLVIEVKIVK